LYPLNWKQQYDIYRTIVSSKTTEKELITIFGEMLAPFKDNHSYIAKGDSFIYRTPYISAYDKEFPSRKLKDSMWKVSCKTLEMYNFEKMQAFGPKEKGISLFYQSRSTDIGYIKISRCYGKTEALFDDILAIADSINSVHLFDSLLSNILDKKALILDLRNNNGGNDWMYYLASRFLDKERITHYISTRQKGNHDNFSAMKPYMLQPNGAVRYLNPIVILTNVKTASAAEGFLIAVKDLPNVTLIGSSSEGIFSNTMNYDIDESQNIWGTLSNEKIFDANKVCYERKGIPVDIEIYNCKNDLEKNVDPIIKKAIEVLGVKK
jgi:C-terminal processing protease CtpA/Prc